jgi:hypothetical protein
MRDVVVQENGGHFTVAYFDRSKQRLFYPQGCNGVTSPNNIVWYPSQSLALKALKRVIHCYYHKQMR